MEDEPLGIVNPDDGVSISNENDDTSVAMTPITPSNMLTTASVDATPVSYSSVDDKDGQYEVSKLRRLESVADLGRGVTSLHHIFGSDINRRNNVKLIEDNRILYISGGNVIFENLDTNKREYLLSIEDGGTGCVEVHPSKKIVAVGGKGHQPNIYIYSYPSLKILKVLKGGAERGYVSLSFNQAGTKLASVASSPDFMLTVWNWEEELIDLHAKAFGQDVFSVRFSVDDDHRLTTSGTGHIRFWKMASTFTGLKLQGSIGKFGKIELSDIASFVELPDGKVVSGTENGSLLLWEGNFIKCRFTLPNGAPCHKGEVTYVEYDREENSIVTAGADGFIRFWNFTDIDTAEVDADISMDFEVKPIAHFSIGDGTGIKSMLDSGFITNGGRFFVILDSHGMTRKVAFGAEIKSLSLSIDSSSSSDFDTKFMNSSHVGAINGISTSSTQHIVATCGSDRTVKFWNYLDRELIATRTFDAEVTSLAWLPGDKNDTSVAAGFADGIVRILSLRDNRSGNSKIINMRFSVKPHTAAVTNVSFSDGGSMVATTGKDGFIFFFDCSGSGQGRFKWKPLRFVLLPIAKVYCTDLSWNHNDNDCSIAVSCSDNVLRRYDISDIYKVDKDATNDITTFETHLPCTEYCPVDAAGAQQHVICTQYTHKREGNKLLISSCSDVCARVYECELGATSIPDVAKDFAIGAYSVGGKEAAEIPRVTCISHSQSREYMLKGLADGSVVIRPTNALEAFVRYMGHSGATTAVTSSFDDKFVLSTGNDGIITVYRIDTAFIAQHASNVSSNILADVYVDQRFKSLPSHIPSEPLYQRLIYDDSTRNSLAKTFPALPRSMDVPLRSSEADCEDVSKGSYSIQDAKLKSEEDLSRLSAEQMKDRVRESIVNLQRMYKALTHQNLSLPESVRIEAERMMVDGDLFAAMREITDMDLQVVHETSAYNLEKSLLLRRHVTLSLMKDLLIEEIPLYSFNKSLCIKSLRTQSLNETIKEVLGSFSSIIKKQETAVAQQRATDALKLQALKNVDGVQDHIQKKEEEKKDRSKTGNNSTDDHSSNPNVRREKRHERKKRLEEHLKQKPDQNDDDERDVLAIATAEQTLGYYRLKSSDSYVQKGDDTVNAMRKKCQIALLEESILNLRLEYNEKFLKLRELKRSIIAAVKANNVRMHEIDIELNDTNHEGSYWEPELNIDEYPDDRDVILASDLNAFRSSRKKVPWLKCTPTSHSVATGTKTTISRNASNAIVVSSNACFLTDDVAITSSSNIDNHSADASADDDVPVLALIRKAKMCTMCTANPTESQKTYQVGRRKALEYERKRLMQVSADYTTAYETAFDDLRVERQKCIVDLNMAEMKLLLVYQEYVLLLTFESRDVALQQKSLKCLGDKNDITASIADSKSRLDSKTEELLGWKEKIAQINVIMSTLVSDSNQYAEYLHKVYSRKVKRSKVNEVEEEEEDDEEEEEEEDDEDNGQEQDICPNGYDQALFDKVLEIREKRVDAEDACATIQKVVDDLKKSVDRMRQKEKQIIKDGLNVELETTQFQSQKQAAMNVIPIAVPLSTSQIYVAENAGLNVKLDSRVDNADPAAAATASGTDVVPPLSSCLLSSIDMKSHVLFDSKALEQLNRQTIKLHFECIETRAQFKELKRGKVRSAKERESKRIEIDALKAKCIDLQTLKFGKVMDIDELEAGSDRTAEQTAEQAIKDEEAIYTDEIDKLNAAMASMDSELVVATKKSTEYLSVLATLCKERLDISRALNEKVGDIKESKYDDIRDAEEKKRLHAYLQLQMREIQSLKAELYTLKRKDVSTYMPTLPNPPTNSLAENSSMTFGGFSLSQSQSQAQNSKGDVIFPPIPTKKV